MLFEVGSEAASRVHEYPGRIAPEVEANVSFEVGGRIVELPIIEGLWVNEGTLLAALDPSDFEAHVDVTEAQSAAAEADYERYRDLLAKNAVSRRDFESRQRNFDVATANLRIAAKALQDTRLQAPFSGRVARRLVDNFQNVQPKEPVVVLQDDSTLEIRVSIPEADLIRRDRDERVSEVSAQIRPQVVISTVPDREFPARLTELSTTADPTTRTFEATFAFEAPDDVNILSGMTASVRVSVAGEQTADAYPIPANAAPIDNSGSAYVWKVDPSSMVVSRATVTLGDLSGGNVFVESGLSAGDLIAVTGVHHLREGMEVRRMDG
jgi:RND family efflux transporter MFP subunit